MKKIAFFAMLAIAGCSNDPSSVNTSTEKKPSTVKYMFTIYTRAFNPAKNSVEDQQKTDTVLSANDTTAYLDAVKKWYNLKIDERKNFLSPSKSFTITDKNGIDLTTKLPASLVTSINAQVKNLPDVKKLIEDTMQDSLPH